VSGCQFSSEQLGLVQNNRLHTISELSGFFGIKCILVIDLEGGYMFIIHYKHNFKGETHFKNFLGVI
jgi:hypothetical protein